MARNLDRMTIFALSCAVVGLVIALLWRKAKDSEVEQEETDLEKRMLNRAKENREWLGEQKHVDRLKNRS